MVAAGTGWSGTERERGNRLRVSPRMRCDRCRIPPSLSGQAWVREMARRHLLRRPKRSRAGLLGGPRLGRIEASEMLRRLAVAGHLAWPAIWRLERRSRCFLRQASVTCVTCLIVSCRPYRTAYWLRRGMDLLRPPGRGSTSHHVRLVFFGLIPAAISWSASSRRQQCIRPAVACSRQL